MCVRFYKSISYSRPWPDYSCSSDAVKMLCKLLVRVALPVLLLQAVSPAALVSNKTSIPENYDCMYDWLRRIGLKHSPANDYQQLFIREEFDETVLRVASLDQLKELGITKLGHRTLIYNSLRLPSLPLCENEAVCNIGNGPSFQCSCLEGFGGERCQYVTGCGDTVCKNGGRCSMESGVVQCSCAAGFTGSCCENDICNQEPCLNGGMCSHSVEGYECSCRLGFEGINCEQVWLNKSSFERLTKQVAFLERLHENDEERSQEALIKAERFRDEAQGPRLFVRESVIGPPGVIQIRHFSVGQSHYTAFLSDTPAQPQLSGITIYLRLGNQSLRLVQTLSIASPTSFTVFSIGSDVFMTVISVLSRGTGGPNTRSALHKWTTNRFIYIQELSAPGARDMEFATAGDVYHFLVISCGRNGQGHVQNSAVYVWFSGRFVFYQSLLTHGGEKVSSVKTSDHQLLVTISSSTQSSIFHWNGTYFALYQELKSFKELYPIQMSQFTFLVAVSDYDGSDKDLMSKLYRLDNSSGQFVAHAHLPTPGAVATEYMHINSEHLIAFGQEQTNPSRNHVSLYKLDGAGVIPFQTLQESGSLSTLKTPGGCVMLTVSKTSTSIGLPNTIFYSWRSTTSLC